MPHTLRFSILFFDIFINSAHTLTSNICVCVEFMNIKHNQNQVRDFRIIFNASNVELYYQINNHDIRIIITPDNTINMSIHDELMNHNFISNLDINQLNEYVILKGEEVTLKKIIGTIISNFN